MDLEDVLYLYVTTLEKNGIKDVTVDDFNHDLRFADRELRKQKYGYERSDKGWETSQQRTDSLRHAKTSSDIDLTTGVGDLPSDYFHASSVQYGTVRVDIVTDYEATERRDNAVLEPSTTYPIAVIGDGDITVYPTTISSVTLNYLKHPTAPQLVLKSENGTYVYSDSSTELEWPEENYIDILNIMLELRGLKIGRTDLVQIMNEKESKEND